MSPYCLDQRFERSLLEHSGFTAVMHSALDHAPWQVAHVSTSSLVAAATLGVLAVDSAFIWRATPHLVAAFAITVIPILVAIRVIRGFAGSCVAAGLTLAASEVASCFLLIEARPGVSQVTAAIALAMMVSATGLVALAGATPRRAVVMKFVHETHDFLRMRPRSS